MRKFYHLLGSLLLTLLISQSLLAQENLIVYQQDFNSLLNTGTSNTFDLPNWVSTRTVYLASTGSSTTGGLHSYGSIGSNERALGSQASGTTGIIRYAYVYTNNTGRDIDSLNIKFVGEQWRNGGNVNSQSLTFEYQIEASDISSGTWVSINELNFTTPIANATAGALDGNNSSNQNLLNHQFKLTLLEGQSIWLRWTDIDDSGSDHGFGIDDLEIIATLATPACTAPAIALTPEVANITANSLDLSWTRGDVAESVLVVQRLSSTASVAPVNGQSYNVDDELGTGNSVVYVNTYPNASTIAISSLLENTSYSFDIYDFNTTDGACYAAAASISASTLDVTPPSFVNSTPATSNITIAGFTINVELNEIGRVYYIIDTETADAPSVAQILVGNNAENSAALRSGTIEVDAISTNYTAVIAGLDLGTTYQIFFVTEDDATAPNRSGVSSLVESTLAGDTDAPVFVSAPSIVDLSYTSFKINFELDEPGTVYYLLLAGGSPAPSIVDIKAGSSYVVNVPSTDKQISISGLTDDAEYDIYLIAEDLANNTQAAAVKLEVSTPFEDLLAPEFVGMPSLDNTTSRSTRVNVQLNEESTVYYAVVANGASAPSAADVKAGTGAIVSGSFAVANPNETVQRNIGGLSPETAYDIYLVAEDTINNLQVSPVMVDVTTEVEYIGGLEDFTNLPLSTASYLTGSYTSASTGITWNYVNARGDQTITGKAITLQQNTAAKIESDSIDYGIYLLKFDYKQPFANNVNLNVYVNDVLLGNVTSSSEINIIKSSPYFVVNQPNRFVIRLQNNTGGNQVAIDNITWTRQVLDLNAITAFTIPSQTSSTINEAEHTISVVMPYGTDVSALTPAITVSTGASIAPLSGVVQDFSAPVVYTVTAENGSQQEWTVSVSVAQNTANDFLTFEIPGQEGSSVINTTDHTISVIMPYGTDRLGLVPSFTVSAEATADPASGVAQDFTNPFNYTVTAQDATAQVWVVSVSNALNTDNDFESFTVTGADSVSLNAINHTVSIYLPYGADRSALEVAYTLSGDALADVAEGITDLSSPVDYTITAQSGTEQVWVVSALYSPNTATDFLSFSFSEESGPAVIDTDNHTIAIEVLNGTDVSALVASFTLSDFALASIGGVEQESGVTAHDFTAAVEYLVTAQSGATQTWTITVTVEETLSDAKEIVTYSLNGQVSSAINAAEASISVVLPFGVSKTDRVASFTLSPGASAQINATNQVSGTTANDFTDAVIYTVTAQDASTKDWTVNVSNEAASTANAILTYAIAQSTGAASIDTENFTIHVEVAYGTNLSTLTPTYTLSAFAMADIASGATVDFSGGSVDYTVTAQDGTTQQVWTVTVTEAPSNETAMLTFSLAEQTGAATIGGGTIAIQVANGTDRSNLIANFTLSAGASAQVGATTQVSGETANNFTSAVTYTVTAANGTSTQDWVVTVTEEPLSLILVENFEYSAGTDLTASGNWTAHSGAGITPIKLVEGSLNYNDYPNSGVGNAVQLNSLSSEDVNRVLNTSVNSGSFYYSAIVEFSSANKPNATGSYFMHTLVGTTTFHARLWAKDEAGALKLGVSKVSNAAIYAENNLEYDTPYLVVVKYTFLPTAGDDQVSLFINPSFGTEPTPIVVYSINETDATVIDKIALRQGTSTISGVSGNYGIVKVDGLRVATDWSTLLPAAGPDETAPVFAATYPKSSNVSFFSADVLVQLNEASTVYYAAFESGAPSPTAADVKAGTGLLNGSASVAANTEVAINLSGLSDNTAYDVYLVAEDASNNLQVAATLVSFTTLEADIIAPSFVGGTPNMNNITANSASLQVQLDEVGTVYYVLLASGASEPSIAQVKAGQNAENTAALKVGTIAVNAANTLASANITGLTIGTEYDVYLVAEDAAASGINTQAAVTKITFSTDAEDLDAPEFIVAPSIANLSFTSFDINFELNETGTVYYSVLEVGAAEPSMEDVKAANAYAVNDPATDTTINITALQDGVDYKVYLIAEDQATAPNIQTSLTILDVSTPLIDVIAPSFATGFPNVFDVASSTAKLNIQIDEAGVAYYVVLSAADAAPSAAQVKAGTNAADESVSIKGSITLEANASAFASITGLSASTAYNVYVVAEDTWTPVPNLSAVFTDTFTTTEVLISEPGGLEDFTNSNATTAYTSNSFVGNNGITWSYTVSRNEDVYPIDGKGLMLRRASENSKIVATQIEGGIIDFSVQFRKAFTGGAVRQLALFINGEERGRSITFGTSTVAEPTIYTFEVKDLNVTGPFDLEIRNITEGQITIDNISWTKYPSGPDIIAPVFAATYPKIENISSTTANVVARINEAGTIYYGLYASGANAPSNAELIAGTNAIAFASQVATANTDVSFALSGLSVLTTYDVYVLAKDEAENVQSSPALVSFTTLVADVIAPVFATDYPQVTVLSSTQVQLSVQIDEPGTVYYAVLGAAEEAPTSQALKTGGIGVSFGSILVTNPAEISTLTIGGLSAATDYVIHVVAEDDEQPTANIQAEITSLAFTTQEADVTAPVFAEGYPSITVLNATSARLATQVDENAIAYYVVLSGAATAPSGEQIKAGTDASDATVTIKGSLNLLANTELLTNLTNLTPSTTYSIYIVAEDFELPSANSTEVQRIDFSTPELQTILFVENFNYPVGTDVATTDSWNIHSAAAGKVLVVEPALSYTGYPNAGEGNAALVLGAASAEDINAPFEPQNTGSVYFSAMVNVSGTTMPTTAGSYFMHFREGTDGPFRARLWVRDNAGKLNFGLSRSGNTPEYFATDFDYDLTHSVVVKYTFVEGATNDIVSLWVNPEMNGIEAAADFTFTVSSADADAVNVQAIALRQNAGAGNIIVDGIRVALNWPELLPSSGPDEIAPNFTAGYPVLNSIASTGAELAVRLDERGTAYYAVYAAGADMPTAVQVKAFEGALVSGSLDISTPNVEFASLIGGLNALTSYDLYVVAEDLSGNLQAEAVKLSFTTNPEDFDAPIFNENYPVISEIATRSLVMSASMNEEGRVYYVVLGDTTELVPTPAQVKAGNDYNGVVAAIKGSFLLDADTETSVRINGLAINTAYKVFVVAEDDEINANLQTEVVSLSATTATFDEVLAIRNRVDANLVPNVTGDVTVKGILHGVNQNPGTPNRFQFALIDNTGGITVRHASATVDFGLSDIAEGDEVIITGTVGEFNGLSQINVTAAERISTGNARVTPLDVTVLDEISESNLVRISNVSIVDPAQWTKNATGFNVDILIGGQAFVLRVDRNATDLVNADFADVFGGATQNLVIVGIGGQFDNTNPKNSGYQIFPYRLSDITVGEDTQAPIFTANFPSITSIAASTAQLNVSMNEAGTAYYVVQTTADVPSVAQVVAGQNAAGTAASISGTITVNAAATTFNSNLTGLSASTEYFVFVVAQDAATTPNVQATVSQVTFTTLEEDLTAPAFEAGYPVVTNITDVSAIVRAKINEEGSVYYVVLPASAATPSVAQVKAGQNAAGTAVSLSGTMTITNAANEGVATLSGLTPSTDYTTYWIAQDDEPTPNVQNAVTSVNFTTAQEVIIPTIRFISTSTTIEENAANKLVQVQIVIDNPASATSLVTVQVGGTAILNTDYTFTNPVLIELGAEETTATLNFTIIDNSIISENKTIVITLVNPQNAVLGANSVHTITIINDDVEVVDPYSGIIGLDAAHLILYPNPSQDRVVISHEHAAFSRIRVFALSGELVLDQSFNATQSHLLSVNTLKSGVYLIEVSGSDATKPVMKRLIKN